MLMRTRKREQSKSGMNDREDIDRAVFKPGCVCDERGTQNKKN